MSIDWWWSNFANIHGVVLTAHYSFGSIVLEGQPEKFSLLVAFLTKSITLLAILCIYIYDWLYFSRIGLVHYYLNRYTHSRCYNNTWSKQGINQPLTFFFHYQTTPCFLLSQLCSWSDAIVFFLSLLISPDKDFAFDRSTSRDILSGRPRLPRSSTWLLLSLWRNRIHHEIKKRPAICLLFRTFWSLRMLCRFCLVSISVHSALWWHHFCFVHSQMPLLNKSKQPHILSLP